jgi:hypothetical protein
LIRGIDASERTWRVVRETLDGRTGGDRRTLVALFRAAATADVAGRHLDYHEARMVQKYAAGDAPLERVTKKIDAWLRRRLRARSTNGIRVHFSPGETRLADRLVDALRSVVRSSRRRRVDVNAMVFVFTEPNIADAILDLAEDDRFSFRMIADFSQLTASGGRQPARIVREVEKRGLSERVEVRFKKDSPYVWDERLRRPRTRAAAGHRRSRGGPRELDRGRRDRSDAPRLAR